MHEGKFRALLMKMPRFERPEPVTPSARAIDFPAWRAIFTSQLLRGHSTGYRLPTLKGFLQICERWYTAPSLNDAYVRHFQDNRRPETLNRLRAFYETGMTETYVYVCLVDMFEDTLRDGIVLYDPRADWKLKLDALVLRDGHIFSVNIYWGDPARRPDVEARREIVERQRKRNTIQSSHFDNSELARGIRLDLAVSEDDHQNVNGLRLMSIPTFNEAVMTPIYETCGTVADERRYMPESPEKRDEMYRSLLHAPMGA